MLLRPRQKELVTRTVTALKKHGNTLGIAPTRYKASDLLTMRFNSQAIYNALHNGRALA